MSARKRRQPVAADARLSAGPVELRIVGGRFRGRKLLYSGDPRVRPMKDRLREAVFNLLGPDIEGKHAIDLFAGTGALALEALSRGAARATLIEQHFPTAKIIQQNIAALGVEQIAQVVTSSVFYWQDHRDQLGVDPWAVFCSPPYDFYVERTQQMLDLVSGLIQSAPGRSVFVVESDRRFDFDRLPHAEAWNVRPYPPAVVGVFVKPG
jgi:16S rRNA (guanine966-N2)-methyltransferase